MAMMFVDNLQSSSVAALAVLHPVAYAGDGAAGQFGFFDDLGIFFTLFKHLGGFEPGADLDNLFLGHSVAQEILHGLGVANSRKNLG